MRVYIHGSSLMLPVFDDQKQSFKLIFNPHIEHYLQALCHKLEQRPGALEQLELCLLTDDTDSVSLSFPMTSKQSSITSKSLLENLKQVLASTDKTLTLKKLKLDFIFTLDMVEQLHLHKNNCIVISCCTDVTQSVNENQLGLSVHFSAGGELDSTDLKKITHLNAFTALISIDDASFQDQSTHLHPAIKQFINDGNWRNDWRLFTSRESSQDKRYQQHLSLCRQVNKDLKTIESVMTKQQPQLTLPSMKLPVEIDCQAYITAADRYIKQLYPHFNASQKDEVDTLLVNYRTRANSIKNQSFVDHKRTKALQAIKQQCPILSSTCEVIDTYNFASTADALIQYSTNTSHSKKHYPNIVILENNAYEIEQLNRKSFINHLKKLGLTIHTINVLEKGQYEACLIDKAVSKVMEQLQKPSSLSVEAIHKRVKCSEDSSEINSDIVDSSSTEDFIFHFKSFSF